MGFRIAVYRPFFRQHLYFDRVLNTAVISVAAHLPYSWAHVTPASSWRRGLRAPGRAPGSACDRCRFPRGQVVGRRHGRIRARLPSPPPLHVRRCRKKDSTQGALLLPDHRRRDNITVAALAAYRARYGEDVTVDQVFAYIYGILHSPEYRERYAVDLAKLLPRIPEVATAQAFHAFASAGQRLLDLHIGYEDAEPYPLAEQVMPGSPPDTPERYRVEKMRWGGAARDPDRSCGSWYNDWITLADIPDEAHDYLVGPRSALAWLLDRYQVKTDKASGIVNDVNDWGFECGEPRYILDLVRRIVTVSVETMAIVRALPELREAEQ